ncbi:MAG: dimethyl sulfoxide reductase anchor subunit [Bacillales bacterium]|nr:dimethyl sulfoxide reductase anchor subunit [Bacillales bacterium]
MEHSFTLVLFTVLSQLAIGGFITLFFLDALKGKLSPKTSQTAAVGVVVIGIVAVLASLFHLGHPFHAAKALLNFGHSWLSREVIFFAIFIVIAIIYLFVSKTEGGRKKIVAGLGTLFGILTVYSTAMIYTIPSMPAWNNGTTLLAFMLTACVLGPLFVQTISGFTKDTFIDCSRYTTTIIGALIVVNLLIISVAHGGSDEAVATGLAICTSPLFWIKAVLYVLAFLISGRSICNSNLKNTNIATILFALMLVAEFLGRIVFYATGVHL